MMQIHYSQKQLLSILKSESTVYWSQTISLLLKALFPAPLQQYKSSSQIVFSRPTTDIVHQNQQKLETTDPKFLQALNSQAFRCFEAFCSLHEFQLTKLFQTDYNSIIYGRDFQNTQQLESPISRIAKGFDTYMGYPENLARETGAGYFSGIITHIAKTTPILFAKYCFSDELQENALVICCLRWFGNTSVSTCLQTMIQAQDEQFLVSQYTFVSMIFSQAIAPTLQKAVDVTVLEVQHDRIQNLLKIIQGILRAGESDAYAEAQSNNLISKENCQLMGQMLRKCIEGLSGGQQYGPEQRQLAVHICELGIQIFYEFTDYSMRRLERTAGSEDTVVDEDVMDYLKSKILNKLLLDQKNYRIISQYSSICVPLYRLLWIFVELEEVEASQTVILDSLQTVLEHPFCSILHYHTADLLLYWLLNSRLETKLYIHYIYFCSILFLHPTQHSCMELARRLAGTLGQKLSPSILNQIQVWNKIQNRYTDCQSRALVKWAQEWPADFNIAINYKWGPSVSRRKNLNTGLGSQDRKICLVSLWKQYREQNQAK